MKVTEEKNSWMFKTFAGKEEICKTFKITSSRTSAESAAIIPQKNDSRYLMACEQRAFALRAPAMRMRPYEINSQFPPPVFRKFRFLHFQPGQDF